MSIVQIYGEEQEGSQCGYCDSKNGSISYGMWANTLTVNDYQSLIQRGWRRSGCYLYKPNMRQTCCPPYTIRLDVTKFQISKSQKKVKRKMERFLEDTLTPAEMVENEDQNESQIAKEGQKEREQNQEQTKEQSEGQKEKQTGEQKEREQNQEQTKEQNEGQKEEQNKEPAEEQNQGQNQGKQKGSLLSKGIKKPKQKEMQAKKSAPQRQLMITLKRSEFTQESYELYANYQKTIHNDFDTSVGGYTNFLVDSPLIFEAKEKRGEFEFEGYGSFHQEYRIKDVSNDENNAIDNKKGQLVAVGVIDILPSGISSVYFYYHPDYSFLVLGTYSALNEINCVTKIHNAYPDFKYYYLGFYIHSCPKMRYKAQYRPSELMDPISFNWCSLETSIELLERAKFTRLERDDHGQVKRLDEGESQNDGPLSSKMKLLMGDRRMEVKISQISNKTLQMVLKEFVILVGPTLANNLTIAF